MFKFVGSFVSSEDPVSTGPTCAAGVGTAGESTSEGAAVGVEEGAEEMELRLVGRCWLPLSCGCPSTDSSNVGTGGNGCNCGELSGLGSVELFAPAGLGDDSDWFRVGFEFPWKKFTKGSVSASSWA